MVSLTLAKQHLRVRHDNEDTIIQQYIDASVSEVEKLSGYLMTEREVTQEFSEFTNWLPVDYGPSPSAITVSYTDAEDEAQEITDALYVRGRLYPADEWPTIADSTAITLTYTAGTDTPPVELVQAVLVLVAGRYDAREGGYDAAMSAATSLCARVRGFYV